MRDPSYRASVLLRLTRSRELHQTTPLTWLDRYPELFAAASRYLESRNLVSRDMESGDGAASPHLLSFGCSTGEEVLTLRRYVPGARITGAEINAASLAACRRLKVDAGIRFVRSSPRVLARLAPFDAIFCMAVLQRTPHRVEGQGLTSLKRVYPFERFEEQVRQLDRWLRPGGLLVIHHTQYVFDHTSVSNRYEPLDGMAWVVIDGLKFDRNSDLLPGPIAVGTIFRKLRD